MGQNMSQNDPTNVSAAFEMLLEEIEAEITFQGKLSTQAFERHDFAAAHKAADYATLIAAFKDETATLRKKWEALTLSQQDKQPEKQSKKENTKATHTRRRDLGRVPKGSGTPQRDYRRPILQVLVEMGGSGSTNDVLTRVEQVMRGTLKPADYEPHAADGMLRWSKAAQWSRNSMAREGLLKQDSPRGIWEISDAGRQALKSGGS